MAPHGTVAVCGLAGGANLNTTVIPFILRGVRMIGINSNYCPQERRRQAWARLAQDLPAETLDTMMQVASLTDVLTAEPGDFAGAGDAGASSWMSNDRISARLPVGILSHKPSPPTPSPTPAGKGGHPGTRLSVSTVSEGHPAAGSIAKDFNLGFYRKFAMFWL